MYVLLFMSQTHTHSVRACVSAATQQVHPVLTKCRALVGVNNLSQELQVHSSQQPSRDHQRTGSRINDNYSNNYSLLVYVLAGQCKTSVHHSIKTCHHGM